MSHQPARADTALERESSRAALKRKSSPSSAATPLCLALVLLFFVFTPVSAFGPNDDGDSNNLGLVAQACSSNFCSRGTNSLDLWLTLEQVCTVNVQPQPYLQALGGDYSADSGRIWSTSFTGFFCVIMGVAFTFAGYRTGTHIGAQHKCLYPLVVG